MTPRATLATKGLAARAPPHPEIALEPPLDERHLDLSYPRVWTYKVFGRDEEALRRAITAVVGALEHRVEASNRSRTGKYVSLGVDVTVNTDEERLAIFRALHDHAEIMYVL